MPLPDHTTPEAIVLLQEAIGHVTVDGTMNQQTIDSVQRLDMFRFRDHFAKLVSRRFAEDGGLFIERIIARASVSS